MFFDRYLKDIENDWEKTPPVRISIYNPGGEDQLNRSENEFPLARTEYTPLYLDTNSMSLSPEPLKSNSSVRYDTDECGSVVFTIKFDSDNEITGFIKLRLWVEAGDSDDMDVFALVQKLDEQGNVLVPESREPGFTGPYGHLRVSRRELDPERSTPAQPYYTFSSEQLLSPGQVVPIDMAIIPIGMVWEAGQQLRLTIAGYNPAIPQFDYMVVPEHRNKGTHIIHTGGEYDSHLLLPIVPIK